MQTKREQSQSRSAAFDPAALRIMKANARADAGLPPLPSTAKPAAASNKPVAARASSTPRKQAPSSVKVAAKKQKPRAHSPQAMSPKVKTGDWLLNPGAIEIDEKTEVSQISDGKDIYAPSDWNPFEVPIDQKFIDDLAATTARDPAVIRSWWFTFKRSKELQREFGASRRGLKSYLWCRDREETAGGK